MPAFITWRLWLRKIYHQKGTELWINRSIAQKVCLIAFIGQKLKTIRSKLRQISAQDSLRALPEMRWICALTIHFIATDLRQFFEVKSCRPLYRFFILLHSTSLCFTSLQVYKQEGRVKVCSEEDKEERGKDNGSFKKGIYVHTYISSHIHSFLHKKRVNLFIKDIIMLVI